LDKGRERSSTVKDEDEKDSCFGDMLSEKDIKTDSSLLLLNDFAPFKDKSILTISDWQKIKKIPSANPENIEHANRLIEGVLKKRKE
jgi:hypothetical protein